jgi:phosphoribosylglycinamide formyltransferase-1
MLNIAIFASGNGSNAQNIIDYFKQNQNINISLILSNKTDAFVLQRAAESYIPSLTFTYKEFNETNIVDLKLKEYNIGFIILAGFLLKVPQKITREFHNKIINIHPALLPKYGGKGMFGVHVHNAVIEAGDKESGITIHYVNENYDEGAIIFQAKVELDKAETADTLAEKIHILEYQYFPEIIEKTIISNNYYK